MLAQRKTVIIENLITKSCMICDFFISDEIEIEDLKKIVEETKIYTIITETTIEEIKGNISMPFRQTE